MRLPCGCRHDYQEGWTLCESCEAKFAEEFEIDRLAAIEADREHDREQDELARMGR